MYGFCLLFSRSLPPSSPFLPPFPSLGLAFLHAILTGLEHAIERHPLLTFDSAMGGESSVFRGARKSSSCSLLCALLAGSEGNETTDMLLLLAC
ncbi:hypothetical protein BCR35DRAFT_28990 [Leucosporidium creatinivorum]|uniref:Uncharacterized protein n=1 Tax=Leucosporidium creatinivorum TaxID=106004 RepID=A0A1Y2CJJ4_9BASI|nr:hypothetical protein BCR35DRAFT_28990 [Leucosporidium creatinivorum]